MKQFLFTGILFSFVIYSATVAHAGKPRSLFAVEYAAAGGPPIVGGLNQVGLGYDIVSGNTKYFPLIAFHYNDTWDDTRTVPFRSFTKPFEIDVRLPDRKADDVPQNPQLFNSILDYEKTLANWMGIDNNFFNPALFSQSSEVQQKLSLFTDQTKNSFAITRQEFIFYQARLQPPGSLTLHSGLQAFINTLPDEYDDDIYEQFIEFFGTHVIYSAELGGRIQMETTLYRESSATGTDRQLATQIRKEFLSFSGQPDDGYGPIDPKYREEHLSIMELQGGDYIGYGVQNWRNWVTSIEQNPIPLSTKLELISYIIPWSMAQIKKNIERAALVYIAKRTPQVGSDVIPGESCKDIQIRKGDLVKGNNVYTVFNPYARPKTMPVFCDFSTEGGGWTVIDFQRSLEWKNFFRSFNYDSTDLNMVSPSPRNTAQLQSFYNWFKESDPTIEFRLSPDCGTCQNFTYDSATVDIVDRIATAGKYGQTYYSTGNFFGCSYANNNCPSSGDKCYTCTTDIAPYETRGTCAHWPVDPAYIWGLDCGSSVWNLAPTLRTNGKFCVCYRKGGAP